MTTGRRRVLLALGAGLLPLAVLDRALGGSPAMPARPAARQPAARVKRFVGVYTPHGRAHELWKPGPGFDLRYDHCSLEPFDAPKRHGASFRDRLLVIDDLDLGAGFLTGTVGHDGARVILTGAGADGRNASVDQALAVEHRLGETTPHGSLVLAVGNDELGPRSCISYGRGGIPLPKAIDPRRVFDTLFGGPLVGASAAEVAAHRRRGKSALDFLSADLQRLRRQAPAADRDKLEHHQEALRSIERRLVLAENQCAGPARPRVFPRLRAYGGGERYFDAITDLQVDLLARALACDLTRFATLWLGDLSRTGLVGALPADIHQDVAHRYLARTSKRSGDRGSWLALARQNHYSYDKVARLLRRLDEARLLDDTLVLVSSDMGDPSRHSSRSVPTLLVGGPVRGGRYLALGDQHRVASVKVNPNNRLLTSICRLHGVKVGRFGDCRDPAITDGDMDALIAGQNPPGK